MLDLVPDEPRVFPVGRLDFDTEGLLLLTNDGELAQLLTHPRYGVEKEYFAEVEGKPSPADLRALRAGVKLDDGPTRPARVKVVQQSATGTTALAIVVNISIVRSKQRSTVSRYLRSASNDGPVSPGGRPGSAVRAPLAPDPMPGSCPPRPAI